MKELNGVCEVSDTSHGEEDYRSQPDQTISFNPSQLVSIVLFLSGRDAARRYSIH